jgi:hypothetical protein
MSQKNKKYKKYSLFALQPLYAYLNAWCCAPCGQAMSVGKIRCRTQQDFYITYANGCTAQPSRRRDTFHGRRNFPQELELLMQVQHVLLNTLEVISLFFMRRNRVTKSPFSIVEKKRKEHERIGRYETDTLGHRASACLARRLGMSI